MLLVAFCHSQENATYQNKIEATSLTNGTYNNPSNVVIDLLQKTVNPKTGDNITIYIILGLVSVAGLVITTVSKKHLQKSLMAVA